ncbi:hypothetical protein SAMN05216390_10183 [Lachnospiraceae bacterium KH1T2]|nr:hypothetical protein SAMN05216390_10183 [Lachnospiraceae bacterium KH1T2]
MSIDKYKDIINLPHPTSKKHPRMSASNRAAQFSPFKALTGYDTVIDDTNKFNEERYEANGGREEVFKPS